ncbi:hypothetical protein AAHE18_17G012300 [Arachis hypogaea]|nr:uncharacterized protein DS421_17g569710 [Arachis hypogaea]RYR00818.1 hypothetical protein Ahy_B07g088927 [Arachis hypogaea]
MLSSCCSILNKSSTTAPSWMAILIAFSLLFSSYLLVLLSFGYFSILYTSLVLLFSSTLFYTLLFSRHKPVVVEEKVLISPPPPPEEDADEIQEQEVPTCEDSEEVDWCSDGSISDEDSLIEIALHKEEPLYSRNYYSLQQKRRELSAAEALFSHHQSLMEFLSELNNDVSEEENLIEIDISMGSIKYSSRFEIKA